MYESNREPYDSNNELELYLHTYQSNLDKFLDSKTQSQTNKTKCVLMHSFLHQCVYKFKSTITKKQDKMCINA